MTIDAGLIGAWLAARSVSRALPAPLVDHGGWRVDTGLPSERRRYRFALPSDEIRALGEAIDEPSVAIKLCRPIDDLLALLPGRWRQVGETGAMVMVRDAAQAAPPALPPGYRCEIETRDSVTAARILAGEAIAASGYAAEQGGVFVYDRIAVDEAHRRRGLGTALMATLGHARRSHASREILTATQAGRGLYRTLGWRDYSAYSTAIIPPA